MQNRICSLKNANKNLFRCKNFARMFATLRLMKLRSLSRGDRIKYSFSRDEVFVAELIFKFAA